MAAELTLDLRPAPAMQMVPSPMLVAFVELLALPSVELDDLVARELAENPALERVETSTCFFCGGRAPRCPRCGIGAGGSARANGPRGDDWTLAGLAQEEPLPDRLLREVAALLPHGEIALAEFVIGGLDRRGLLDEPPEAVARRLGVEPAAVRRVIRAIQEAGPPGIAAADLRGSLLLQLDALDDAHGPAARRRVIALARRVVDEHLEAMGRGRFAAVARTVGVTVADVLEVRALIQQELSPSPVDGVGSDPWARPRSGPAVPDLVIVDRPDGSGAFDIDMVEAVRCALRVDPTYRELAHVAGPMGSEVGRVRDLIGRADLFIARLRERWAALRRIGGSIVEHQQGFLRRGASGMEPLTRADVARAVGLHESTVSRAVAGKFAMLPSGRVVPLADFFDRSLGVRTELRAIIAEERRPLSDAELVEELRDRGYRVARRTVAKYRDRLRILPAALR
jgi:RNA polymerase sigma-54 factor